MNCRKLIFILAIVSSITCSTVPVRAQGSSDALLEMLPEDCIAILRINNLDDALTKLDTYLAGASPVPLTLLVNTQLIGITGDPAMTGIDKKGSFALVALPFGEEEVKAGFLFPVTGFDEFVAAGKNITKSEDGTLVLGSAQSQMGSFALASALNGKYAIAVPEQDKEFLSALKKSLEDKTSKRLADRLKAVEAKEAAAAPVWGFVNISLLYSKYGEELTSSIEEGIQAASQGEQGGMMAAAGKMYAEMFKTFVGDADSLTLTIQPEAALLTVDTVLRAKDNSALAKMLQKDPAAAKEYRLAGFADNSHAVNGVMRVNQPLFRQYSEKMIQVMDAAAKDGTQGEQAAKMKDLMNQAMQMMGSEIAFSFSYAAGMPPMRLREVIEMKEGSSMKTLIEPGISLANAMYKSMQVPFEISYQPGTEKYKDVAIDSMKLAFTQEGEADAEAAEAMKMMGGPEGMQYYIAQKGSLVFMTMGAKGIDEMKSLIDQPSSAPAAGDMKTALDMLNTSGHTDMAVSMNIIRLMKGLGEMLQSMGGQNAPNPIKNIFSGLNIQSQSCLVMGGKIADGQFALRTALPKQHLVEVVTAGMQIQQQMMQQQMQPGQQPGSASPAAPAEPFAAPMPNAAAKPNAEQAPDLKTWVGKKAPELKMTDLDGQIHRVSRLKGKKVVLDFWATWCNPCKESIPHLIDAKTKAAPEKAAIIGLSNEAKEKVTEYVKGAKINYPIAIYSEELPAPYNKVTGLPTMFLIDAEGTIVDIIEGYDPATTPGKLEAFLK